MMMTGLNSDKHSTAFDIKFAFGLKEIRTKINTNFGIRIREMKRRRQMQCMTKVSKNYTCAHHR